jgi:amino-acid N-acetyltransferase
MSNSSLDGTARVRPAERADLGAIERLLTVSGLPLDGVRDALDAFVVAQSGDDLVGVAGLEVCCDNALLRSVAVSPDWRSHGLGRALVTRVISDAEARGIHALYLLTTTAARASGLTRSLGKTSPPMYARRPSSRARARRPRR